MKRMISALVVMLTVAAGPMAGAAPPPHPEGEAAKAEAPAAVPKAESSVTTHSIVIDGTRVEYTATAGTLIVRNGKDEPYASMGYVAYTKNGVKDLSRRPLTFAYNGGPGSSSIWLHMGALGPRRIVTTDAEATPPPPYQVVDNAYSIVDRTDLVMIDPVGTGLSKAVGKAEDKDFFGVDPDIESMSRFITEYVNENDRWNSPKYLLGESYGTTRSAGMVDYLQTREGMSFNGVILVSCALDIGAIFNQGAGADLPYALYLPTYAAVAWYHDALPDRPAELAPFLDEVRDFAEGEYLHALALGAKLPAAEREAVVEKLHRYTGLSQEYLDKADLRVGEPEFTKELLRSKRETVGRLDARFVGFSFDPLGERAEYDPQDAAVSGAFTAAFMDYLHRDLRFGRDRTYVVSAPMWGAWSFEHRVPGSPRPQPLVNTSVDLAHALGFNPHLRVLALQGHFDLATPELATEYVFDHMGLDAALRSHVETKTFDAGHMMYLHEPSLKKFKAAVAGFIDATSPH